ncbi:hypothetical protein ACIF83_41595 [Streptomyces sp. NPDC085866]
MALRLRATLTLVAWGLGCLTLQYVLDRVAAHAGATPPMAVRDNG